MNCVDAVRQSLDNNHHRDINQRIFYEKEKNSEHERWEIITRSFDKCRRGSHCVLVYNLMDRRHWFEEMSRRWWRSSSLTSSHQQTFYTSGYFLVALDIEIDFFFCLSFMIIEGCDIDCSAPTNRSGQVTWVDEPEVLFVKNPDCE